MNQAELDRLVFEVATLTDRNTSLDSVSGTVLAHHTIRPTTDRARIDSVLLKTIPEETRRREADLGAYRHTRAFHVPGDEASGLYDRVCIPLLVRGMRVGSFWLLAHDTSDDLAEVLEIVERDREIFDQLAGRVLVAIGAVSERTSAYDEVFQAVLQGRIPNPDSVDTRLFSTPHPLNLLVFSALHHVNDRNMVPALAYQQAIIDAARMFDTEVVRFSDEHHGVCLLSSQFEIRDFLQHLSNSLKLRRIDSDDRPIEFGFSEKVRRWEDVRAHYHHAVLALQATAIDPAVPTHNAKDVGLYRYLITRSAPPHTSRYQMLKSNPDGEEWLRILETVYDTPGPMQQAADRLFMHRTSVYNHLQRIEKFLGISPLDPWVRLELHTALKSARWETRPRIPLSEIW